MAAAPYDRYARFGRVISSPPALARSLAVALGGTFLITSPWNAGILWLALLRDIRFPLLAFAGLLVADIITWLLRIDDTVARSGAVRSNAVFAALAIAWLTTAAPQALELKIGVTIAASVGASLIAAALAWFLRNTALPPLQWGYCIAAAIAFTLFPLWAQGALQATLDWPYPVDAIGWLQSLLRSLGMLLFMPRPEIGALVLLAILLWSPTMLVTGILGWIAGVSVGLFLQGLGLRYLWLLAAHNYFLAAMILASSIFMPGWARPVVCICAGASAAIVSAYFQYLLPGSAYAFLPVPAALTVWIGIGAVSLGENLTSFPLNTTPDVPPEISWWNWTNWQQRFGHGEPLLIVPVAGTVQIRQGFDGQLSHSGQWRHALDFQRPTAAGAEYGNAIWGAPVYAPASGYVESVRNHIADNPVGVSNFAENWGNYVIIRLDQGSWAMLAHLRQGTITVGAGARVDIGTYVGQVGNSGRSPTPHLHLQAQVGPEPGARTKPFRLANYLSAADTASQLLRWTPAGVPVTGTIVAAAPVNPKAHATLTAFAPGAALWQAETTGSIPLKFRANRSGAAVPVRIALDEAGRHMFSTPGGGTLITLIDADAWRLLEVRNLNSSLLRLLALAAPSVPYAADKGIYWQEPIPIPPWGLQAWWLLPMLPFIKRSSFPQLRCHCTGTPEPGHEVLTVESELMEPMRGMPARIVCEIDRVRGPVKVHATFDKGTLTYSMFSFEPGFPFERRRSESGFPFERARS